METVLVATGDRNFGARFGRALAEMGYQVLSAASPAEALRQVQEAEVHVLVADAALGMAETADLLSRVHRRRREVPALVAGEPAALRKLPPPILERAFHLIPSEPTADRLAEAVARAVAQNRQYREDSRRLRQLEKLKESAMELANMVRWDELGKFLQDHEAFSRKLIDLIALTMEVERVSLMLIDDKTPRMRIA